MTRRSKSALFALVLCAGTAASAFATDKTWTNGSGNFQWDTSSLNWDGTAWSNAAGDGAVFIGFDTGTINVTKQINVDSLDFQGEGYILSGKGSLHIVDGASTLPTSAVSVITGVTIPVNVPITSTIGMIMQGGGVLELNAPCFITGNVPLTFGFTGAPFADVLIGGPVSTLPAGTLRPADVSVLDPSTRLSISSGLLDIGANDITLSSLTFTNAHAFQAFDPATGVAAAGVIGTGTFRVTGDINVLGAFSGNVSSNSIGAPFDLGGGTQVIRVGAASSFGLSAMMQLTGVVSNGSLLKTIGFNPNGVMASVDGMLLSANNTYTGATTLNGGANVVTGTNASNPVKITGQSAGLGSSLTLQGADGSYGNATLVQCFSGSFLVLDNNASLGGVGSAQPTVPAAQNNDRLRDDAEVQLRDANFQYKGFAAAAATETFGDFSVLGGHNVVTLTPSGGGSVAVTASGDFFLAPRATMQISTATLGAASKLFVNGSMPEADATDILPRMIGTSDFLTYNGKTGFTPYTAYTTDLVTPDTNVALTAAATVASSININALKTAGSFTTTINPGQVLGINSGMIFDASGTQTINGGTIAFGSTPGVLLGGTMNIGSAITGTQGIVKANGTATLSGDLSGLTGTITNSGTGTLNLNTNTFIGDLEVRGGQLAINTSQTLAGQGAIRIGVPQNDVNLTPMNPSLSLSGAGANSTFARDIVFDNGALNVAGVEMRYSLAPTISPLSNTTGSQTISGNVILNTHAKLQGGGGGGTGSTNFTGNVSGQGRFYIPNGRASFSGNVSNDAGFLMGDQGFSAKVTFSGTASGAGPIKISGGNSNTFSYAAGSIPTGQITVFNSDSFSAPTIIPTNSSTIPNAINIATIGKVDVGAGITAEWAGPVSGAGALTKQGAGTLVLSSPVAGYTGAVSVNVGTLRLNGTAASASVASGAVLGGTGAVSGATSVVAGAALEPGNSVGAFGTGNLTVAGTIAAEIDLATGSMNADLVNTTGSVDVSGATLALQLLNAPSGAFSGTFIIVANDGVDAVTGQFASTTGLPEGFTADVTYSFTGTDSLGRVGDGNDIAVTVVHGQVCLTDWDHNGVVNSTDVSSFINSWFQDQALGTLVTDFDHNGVVNSTDVSMFINAWFAESAFGC